MGRAAARARLRSERRTGWETELARSPRWREQLIGEVEGRPIGFVQIIDPAEEESRYWGAPPNLRAIDIWIGDEADLNHDYGTAMMKLAIARCFGPLEVTAILIDPLASNTAAHRFNEWLGFRFAERTKRSLGKRGNRLTPAVPPVKAKREGAAKRILGRYGSRFESDGEPLGVRGVLNRPSCSREGIFDLGRRADPCVLLCSLAWRFIPHHPSENFPVSKRRQKADEFRHLADEIAPEDGTDPKDFHAKPWNAPKQAGRKGKQLCAQVRHSLEGTFAAASDPLIQTLSVVGVEPAPHSGRLRVLVSAPPDVGAAGAAEALARAGGFLRSEVAAAISRRYAPELVFELVPS